MRVRELFEAKPNFTPGDITKIVLYLNAINDNMHDHTDEGNLDILVWDKLVEYFKVSNLLPKNLTNISDDDMDGPLIEFITDKLDSIFEESGMKGLKSFLSQ